MRLGDILAVDRIAVELRATAKPDVLRELSALVATGASVDPAAVAEVFASREALASTGVGSGVAIPHGRIADLDSLRAAIAVTREGVDFDAIDGRPVHILVAVLGPERQTGEHLKALARFSRLLRDPGTRTALREARDAERVFQVLVDADGR